MVYLLKPVARTVDMQRTAYGLARSYPTMILNPDQFSATAWEMLATGHGCPEFEFLALKITLGNLRQRIQSKTATMTDMRQEVISFFSRYHDEPVAQRDWQRIVDAGGIMPGTLCTVAQVAERILRGTALVVAGEEALLSQLPEGRWIGGTIPYFMTADGGCLSTDRVFVTELPDYVTDVEFLSYDPEELCTIYEVVGANEVSLIILPYGSAVHEEFALNAPNYPGFATHPLIGWVAGTRLDGDAAATPACYCGRAEPLRDRAVILRFRLPPRHHARIDVINLFEQGVGDRLRFPCGGLAVGEVLVNGEPRRFADYLHDNGCDLRLPLVADYCSTMVNASIKRVRADTGEVEFFGPVWPGIDYRQALPVADYVGNFETRLGEVQAGRIVFSCNCVLNYLYSNLEGCRTGSVVGPMTFGEVAYQLLNQTLVYLTIEESRSENAG